MESSPKTVRIKPTSMLLGFKFPFGFILSEFPFGFLYSKYLSDESFITIHIGRTDFDGGTCLHRCQASATPTQGFPARVLLRLLPL